MTIVGLFLLALACIGYASEALDDSPRTETPPGESRAADGLLFALCLASVLAAHKRKSQDEEF